MRRVVITGMGAVTPIGNDIKSFWENIKEGTCGIGEITRFDTSDYKYHIAAEIKDLNLEDHLDRKAIKRLSAFSQFAMVAAIEAHKDSGINEENTDMEMVGTYVSTGVGGLSDCEREYEKILTKGPGRVSPLYVPMMISNMASGNIAIYTGARGSCMNIVTACASSNNSVGEAFYAVRDGRLDVVYTGGTEAPVSQLGMSGFTNLGALADSNDPQRASIPFDKERSGFVMGEGAGVLVLEELEHAKKRGAKIYGEIVGYGSTCDAYHMTAPREDGSEGGRAMAMAIKVAGIEKEEVGYINAHGTSTPLNDKTETKAIKDVFGDYAYKIPVSSTKSMTGHLLGAAGAVEAIVCLKALDDGFIPPTINYEIPDPECDLDIVPNEGRQQEIKYALTNSLGFGGHNASLLFKKWEE